MQEPEININNNDKADKPAPKKKRTFAKVILILLVLALIVIGGGVYYVKSTYSEAYFISLCEKEISEATNGDCKVGRFQLSLLGSVEINDVVLAPKNEKMKRDTQFLQISTINANIDILKSIMNFQPTLTLDVVGVNLQIERVEQKKVLNDNERLELAVKKEVLSSDSLSLDSAPAVAEEFSTNINQVIASVVELPWKEWVAGFDWKIADVDAKVRDVNVLVHDQSGNLKDVKFTVDFGASLKKTGTKVNLLVTELTPDVTDGKVELNTNIKFDWDAADRRPDKPLAFIGSSDIELNINNLDLGYLGKYYMQSNDQQVRLAAPLTGRIVVSAEDLTAVKLNLELGSKKAVEFFENNKLVVGGEPSINITAGADVDLSNEWSNIRTGFVTVNSKNADNNSEFVNFNVELFGSFGDEVVVSVNSDVNVGSISSSAIGKVIELYNIAKGSVILGSEFTWKRRDDWKYALNFRSKDLVIKNKGTVVPAPITMLATGVIKPLAEFTPESMTVQLKLKAPGVEALANKGMYIPLNSGNVIPQGQASVTVDAPKLFSAFAAPLNKLGLKSINEVITLDLKLNAEKNASVIAEMKNTKGQYAPCVIGLSYAPKGSNGFTGKIDVMAENKAVQLKATAEGVKESNGITSVKFNKQVALRIGAGLNLLKRIQNVIPGFEVAQYPVTGILRGTVNGNVLAKGDSISLAANNSIAIDNMTFTTDSGKKFVEKKATLTGSFSIRDMLRQQLLSIKSLDLKGDSGSASVKVERVELGVMANDIIAGIESIKDLKVTANLGTKAFTNLHAMLGDKLPAWVKEGESFDLELTNTDGVIEINKFDLQGAGLVASVNNLVVNPVSIMKAVDNGSIGKIIPELSPFTINAKANRMFWSELDLPVGLKFSGEAELAVSLDPKLDRVTISKVVLAGDRNNRAFISRMSAATIISNLSKLIDAPTLPLILESLPSGVNIPVVTISVPILKEYLASSSNGNQPNIQGRDIELSNLRIIKTKTKNTLQLVGAVSSTGVAVEDMFKYSGVAKLNNLIAINDTNVKVTGEINLDNADVNLQATPYVYYKPKGEATKVYYKLASNDSGLVEVDRAGIKGGALQFDLSKLMYQPKDNGTFKFELPVFRVLAPFELTASNISIDPDRDVVLASVVTKKIDLDRMSSSLNTGLPSKLSGSIGAIKLGVSDRYSTFFGSVNKRLSRNNRLSVEPSSVSLKSNNASMTIDVGKISGSTVDGKFVMGGVNITSPTGFSDPTPIRVGQVDSVIDLDALANGRSIITEVVVSSLKAVYEMKLPKNNISVLQSNINKLLPAETPKTDRTVSTTSQVSNTVRSSNAATTTSSSAEAEQGILIKDLYINNGVVNLKTQLLNTEIDLPQTHIQNIGGSNPRVAFTTILNVLLKSIGQASVSILDKSAGSAVKSVTNILGQALNNKDKTGNKQGEDDSKNDPVKSVTNILNNVLNDGKTDDGKSSDQQLDKGVDALMNLFQ